MMLPHFAIVGVGVARVKGKNGYHKTIGVQVFGRPLSKTFEVTVSNQSPQRLSYTFGKKRFDLEPTLSRWHSHCVPQKIGFPAHLKAATGRQGPQAYLTGEPTTFAFSVSGGRLTISQRNR